MTVPFDSTGHIISSSQVTTPDVQRKEQIHYPMLGIIISVHPSDHEQNSSATVTSDDRGWRHECTVLVVQGTREISMILENVAIPPQCHSGMDNFEEDLPRGLSYGANVNGTIVRENFFNVSPFDLDAEWCVVNFIGGSIQRPFIQNWWHHPRNNKDLATAQKAKSGATTLKQVDVDKNRFRKFRRLNGVQSLINPQGDVYLNTTEANSEMTFDDGKIARRQYAKGGSIQVDVKASQQLEFNWNKPIEGLAAGSSSATQVRDPALSHTRHDRSNPKVRETSRTLIRTKEFSHLLKTSQAQVYCQNTESEEGGKKGECVLIGEDTVQLAQGEGTVSSVVLQDGAIKIIERGGTIVYVQDDEVVIKTTSNGMVNIAPGGAVSITGTNVSIATMCGVGPAAQALLRQPVATKKYTDAEKTMLSSITTALSVAVGIYKPQSTAAPPVPLMTSDLVALVALLEVSLLAITSFTGSVDALLSESLSAS